jgi:uncharacterized protein
MHVKAISSHCGLSEAAIEKIRGVLQTIPAIEKATLYGSRAKGNFREGSDVDLTLSGQDLTYPMLASVDSRLDDLMLPYTFDISIFSQIDNNDLIDHIRRVGIDFYVKTLPLTF